MSELNSDHTAPEQTSRTTRRESNPRKELVREELMDIAARMFDERGFDRVSMAMIASEVGLGRSAVYHYFSSKDEILAAIIDSEANVPVNRMRVLAYEPDKTATERLRNVVADGVVRRLSSGSRFVRLARLEAQIPPDLRADYNKSRRAIFDEYVRLIEEGMASREFRVVDSHIAAFAIIGMGTWTSRWFNPKGRMTSAEVATIIADLALASIRATSVQDRVLDDARQRLRAIGADLDDLLASLG
ncbi:MAG: TetR/AcrR family transcriptional regulator [Cypionkella sp.]|jgi:AcrR family transcriptional regulator|nr:TetR/AcrR family transcriptional regulator [Cypionkella sp.]